MRRKCSVRLALFLVAVAGAGGLVTPVPAFALEAAGVSDAGAELAQVRTRAEAGDAGAQFQLAEAYRRGRGVERDLSRAVVWYERAANQGHANAQYQLGVALELGDGVASDPKRAAKRYAAAAEQGFAPARYNLGHMYLTGAGIGKDPERGAKLWRQAAEQGEQRALHGLGVLAMNQDPPDFEGAAGWFRRAAESGYAPSQTNLAILYEQGRGVERDATKAVQWYTRAAQQGDPRSQLYLGRMYRLGEGVEKDLAQSAVWIRQAADQGLAPAQYALGVAYLRGDGVTKDPGAARAWLKRAATQGHERAQTVLKAITPPEIAGVSDAPSYGYTPENPVKVGGGAVGEHRYLRALQGPDGEAVRYERIGNCCPFKSDSAPFGQGVLDQYRVWIEGREEPVELYLNMYERDTLYAPRGFTYRKPSQ